jgi:hypothetical protein
MDNLFIGGRLMSASHVAFGSSRVMCTSAHGGQAIGMAAALCIKGNKKPADFIELSEVKTLQRALIATGQYIPQLKLNNFGGKLQTAAISVSSELSLSELKSNGSYFKLNFPMAMLLPLKGRVQIIQVKVKSAATTTLSVEIRSSHKAANFSPESIIFKENYELQEGEQYVDIDFSSIGVEKGYYFICFMKNDIIELAESDQLVTGLMSVFNYQNPAVSNYGIQVPPDNIGVEKFELWCPMRRPKGKNLALKFTPTLEAFEKENLKSELLRPIIGTNAWVASYEDKNPTLTLNWNEVQEISSIRLFFDTDADHAMENVQMGHFDSAMPFCVKEYRILDENGMELFSTNSNHQTVNTILLPNSIQVKSLKIEMKHPSVYTPAALFGVIVY